MTLPFSEQVSEKCNLKSLKNQDTKKTRYNDSVEVDNNFFICKVRKTTCMTLFYYVLLCCYA